MSQKEKKSYEAGKIPKTTSKTLQEKWTEIYDAIVERKIVFSTELIRRKSCERSFCECLSVLDNIHKTLDVDTKAVCFAEELETLKKALAELETCQTTVESLQILSSEKERNICDVRTKNIASFASQCVNTKKELQLRLAEFERLQNNENEFNCATSDLLNWIASAEKALVIDIYALPEEERQNAILEQEQLVKEFCARKSSLERLLMLGNELRTNLSDDHRDVVGAKLTEVARRWEGLEQMLSLQQEKIEECLTDHQTYYDSVEEIWSWMQGIGKRLEFIVNLEEMSASEVEIYQCLLIF